MYHSTLTHPSFTDIVLYLLYASHVRTVRRFLARSSISFLGTLALFLFVVSPGPLDVISSFRFLQLQYPVYPYIFLFYLTSSIHCCTIYQTSKAFLPTCTRIYMPICNQCDTMLQEPNAGIARESPNNTACYSVKDVREVQKCVIGRDVYEGPGSGSTHVPFGHSVAGMVKSPVCESLVYCKGRKSSEAEVMETTCC